MSEQTQVAAAEQQNQPSGETQTTTPVETNEPVNVDWKTTLPDDIKTDESLKHIQDVPSLAKSYIHAQKMVGADKIAVPNKYATEDDWKIVYEKLGLPKSPDQYKYELPQDTQVDENTLKSFSSQAHNLGLLPQQAKGVVKFYNDMVNKTMSDADNKAMAFRENSTKELKMEYGQAYDENISKAKNLANSIIDANFLNSPMADGTKVGDHPALVKGLVKLAGRMGEDSIVQASGPAYLTPKQIDKQIAELTSEGSAYWDKHHPNHDEAVEEVLALRNKKNSV